MWWTRSLFQQAARGVLLAALLGLGGCGFRPLYGDTAVDNIAEDLANIEIRPIPDRIGQELHNHLLDLFNPKGRPIKPIVEMRTTLKESKQTLAVEKTAFATRANLILQATFDLRWIDPTAITTAIIFRSNSMTVTSYNVLTEKFATLRAENDARSRAARALAQDIRVQVAGFFQRLAEKTAKERDGEDR